MPKQKDSTEKNPTSVILFKEQKEYLTSKGYNISTVVRGMISIFIKFDTSPDMSKKLDKILEEAIVDNGDFPEKNNS